MTYGVVPDYATFEKHFDEEVPRGMYNIRLSSGDSKNVGKLVGDGEYTCKELYNVIKKLKDAWENGNEAAGDFASSIMETLGFEWV